MFTRLLSTKEAAAYLGVPKATIYKLIRSGRLKHIRTSERGPYLIPESALETLTRSDVHGEQT